MEIIVCKQYLVQQFEGIKTEATKIRGIRTNAYPKESSHGYACWSAARRWGGGDRTSEKSRSCTRPAYENPGFRRKMHSNVSRPSSISSFLFLLTPLLNLQVLIELSVAVTNSNPLKP